jgi:predicted nucleic acid-binding Zn ribbon protein
MKRQRKNSKGFEHIGRVLQNILEDQGVASNTRLSRIWEVWADAVGSHIAANAVPAAIKGKLLIVNAESSAWIQQLHFLKQEMIVKINRTLGEDLVIDIKFKIGPLR